MTLDGLAPALLIGALIVIVAVLSVRLAGRLGVPGLLLYLVLGLALGTFFPPLHIDNPQLPTVLGYSALILILAQGGLTTRMSELRPVLWPALTLASVGIVVSIVVVAGPLILLGVETRVAVLIGAVLAATDAAAVFSVMRRMRITARVRTLLEAEAGFNDAPVVVIVAVVSAGDFGSGPWWSPPLMVGVELVGGALVGIAAGFAARWVLPRLALPAVGLYPIAVIATLVFVYGAGQVLHVSGFMAVYLAAVLIGSTEHLPHRRAIVGFSDGLAWVAEIGLFVMLGAFASVDRLPAAIPLAVIVAILIVVLARPIAAAVSLLPYRLPLPAVGFVGIAGLRGAVPIVFAAIPLGLGVVGAATVFDVTLLVVLILMVVQIPLITGLGRRLGVVLPGEASELEVESAPLDGMRAVVLGVDVPAGRGLAGLFVTELGLPEGAVVALVVRDGSAIAPDLQTRLRSGDQVMIVTTEAAQAATSDRLMLVAKYGRLAGWHLAEHPSP